ncbi:hypothetical protein EK904_004265, partial [Melospiza melodia maxima]
HLAFVVEQLRSRWYISCESNGDLHCNRDLPAILCQYHNFSLAVQRNIMKTEFKGGSVTAGLTGLDCRNRNQDLAHGETQSCPVGLLSCTQYMASNTILAYAMEQGAKMGLGGMRNPVLGKADVSAAQGSSPGKVQGSGQRSKKGIFRDKVLCYPLSMAQTSENTKKKKNNSNDCCAYGLFSLSYAYRTTVSRRKGSLEKEPVLTQWGRGCALLLLVPDSDTVLHQDVMDPVLPRAACGSWDFKSFRMLSSTNGMFLSSPAAPTSQAVVVDQRQLWKSPSSAEAAGNALVVGRGGRANSFVLDALLTKVAEEMPVKHLSHSLFFYATTIELCCCQSLVLSLRQSSSYPKAHLRGHLVLHPSDSAACVNALALLKAVRGSGLKLKMGERCWQIAQELCCFPLQRAFLPQSPAGLAGCKALLKVSALSRRVSASSGICNSPACDAPGRTICTQVSMVKKHPSAQFSETNQACVEVTNAHRGVGVIAEGLRAGLKPQVTEAQWEEKKS